MPSDNAHRDWLVIPLLLSRSTGKKLLGSVITDDRKLRPAEHFVPDQRKKLPASERKQITDLTNNVWSHPEGHVDIEILTQDRSNTWSGKASIEIANAFKSWLSHGKSNIHSISSGKTKRYTIENIPFELKDYMACPPWWRSVQELYEEKVKKHGKVRLYLITGIWLCSDMEATSDSNVSTSAGAGANLTPDQQAPTIKGEVEVTKSRGAKATYKVSNEVVFAVRYHTLELTEEEIVNPSEPPPKHKWWKSPPKEKKLTKVTLGHVVRGTPLPFAGSDEDEEDVHSPSELRDFYTEEPDYASDSSSEE